MAILGDGSFRDSLGVLQKVLNFSKTKKITTEEIEKITGAPKTILVNNFLISIVERNIDIGIKTVRTASTDNLDMKLYLKLIIQKLRMAIILRYAPKIEKEMTGDLSEEDLKFIKELVEKDKNNMLRSGTLATLLEAYQNIERAFISELPLELALIKILAIEK